MPGYLLTGLLACAVILPGAVRAAAAETPPGTEPVPMEVRDMVEDNISKHLVLPETAEWRFSFMAPYAGGGKVVCGQVNYQSAQRKYVGYQSFYAIIRDNAVGLSQLKDPDWFDASGQEAKKFELLCDRH